MDRLCADELGQLLPFLRLREIGVLRLVSKRYTQLHASGGAPWCFPTTEALEAELAETLPALVADTLADAKPRPAKGPPFPNAHQPSYSWPCTGVDGRCTTTVVGPLPSNIAAACNGILHDCRGEMLCPGWDLGANRRLEDFGSRLMTQCSAYASTRFASDIAYGSLRDGIIPGLESEYLPMAPWLDFDELMSDFMVDSDWGEEDWAEKWRIGDATGLLEHLLQTMDGASATRLFVGKWEERRILPTPEGFLGTFAVVARDNTSGDWWCFTLKAFE